MARSRQLQDHWQASSCPLPDPRRQTAKNSLRSGITSPLAPRNAQNAIASAEWDVTGSSGVWPASPDGRRKGRTNPESAAVRREFVALEPPAVGVPRSPSSERSARVPCWRPQSAKLPGQARFGHAFCLAR